jgi:aldehyde:ferredoxin oxidoreductase
MDSMKAAHREARQEFWEQLPKMYGLPGWEELEKMKAEDLKEIKASD